MINGIEFTGKEILMDITLSKLIMLKSLQSFVNIVVGSV
jgi:hypothetical protein